MPNSKSKGDCTEAMVLAALIKQGKVVLLPFGDNQRYDMAIDNLDGTFTRVQCKTARLSTDGSTFAFKACSTYAHRGRTSKSYRGQADVFGVYCPTLDKVYLVPVGNCGEALVTLRVGGTRNGQVKGVRLAKDFELAR